MNYLYFQLIGKTAPIYLDEQLKDMIRLSAYSENKVPISLDKDSNRSETLNIDHELLILLGTTYKDIATKLDVKADLAYRGASYYPFDTTLNTEDYRSIYTLLIRSIYFGKYRSALLRNSTTASQEMAGVSRSTINPAEKPQIETTINEIAGELNEMGDER